MAFVDVVGIAVSVEVEVDVVGEAGRTNHRQKLIHIGNLGEHLEAEACEGDIQIISVGCRILPAASDDIAALIITYGESPAAE